MFFDHASLSKMEPLYDGGPEVTVTEGSIEWNAEDFATITPTNDRAGEFQTGFDRLFLMRDKGLLLRSIGDTTETVADSLIS